MTGQADTVASVVSPAASVSVATVAAGADDARPVVVNVRRALQAAFAAERRLRGRDHGGSRQLTHGQLRSIAELGRAREMTAGQLAKSAELGPASVTAMLDQLEAANIVHRRRSTEDRRVCNVSLTREGRRLLETKLTRWRASWHETLSDFTDEELEIAVRVITRCAEMIDAMPDPGGSGD